MKFFLAFISMGLFWVEAQGVVLERRADGLWYNSGNPIPYTGKDERRHFDGIRISEINYLKGKQHGPSRFWYSNGNIRSTFNYNAGALDGNSTYYYRNGNIQNLTSYRQGVKHGLSVDYWPEGKKSFEEHYVNGFPDGPWRSWWPSGKLESEKMFRKLRLVLRREWMKDGTPRQLPGWNLDGTVKTVASAVKARQTVGRRILWNCNSGGNRIDLLYRDKPLATLRKVFGDPDESDDRRWIFKGLRIQDPVSGDSFDTAVFRYKDGKVTAIRIE